MQLRLKVRYLKGTKIIKIRKTVQRQCQKLKTMWTIVILSRKNNRYDCVIIEPEFLVSSLLRHYDVIKPWENLPQIVQKWQIFKAKLCNEVSTFV